MMQSIKCYKVLNVTKYKMLQGNKCYKVINYKPVLNKRGLKLYSIIQQSKDSENCTVFTLNIRFFADTNM